MASTFGNIGIIGKLGDARLSRTLHRLTAYLKAQRCHVWLDEASHSLLADSSLPRSPVAELGRRCDLVIVVGGDGTLLHAARILAASGVALFGINLGRLGFLVDVSPEGLEKALDQILAGAFVEEQRFLLESRIAARVGEGEKSLALNDVVVHRWNSARMIEFETYVDGSFVNAQRSDGLIVSTPTGSTAYALSGGGPLLHPTLNALLLVPICPHTLSNRPLAVSGDSRVEIRICGCDHEHVRVTCDGQATRPIRPGETVYLCKSEHPIRLLHPENHDHYQILRAKLGWGGHPQTLPRC
jgi:NAD+ kinase